MMKMAWTAVFSCGYYYKVLSSCCFLYCVAALPDGLIGGRRQGFTLLSLAHGGGGALRTCWESVLIESLQIMAHFRLVGSLSCLSLQTFQNPKVQKETSNDNNHAGRLSPSLHILPPPTTHISRVKCLYIIII